MENSVIVDVNFGAIPKEILWLHRQGTRGVADKYQGREVAFVIRPEDITVAPGMQEWAVVVLGYKTKPVVL